MNFECDRCHEFCLWGLSVGILIMQGFKVWNKVKGSKEVKYARGV